MARFSYSDILAELAEASLEHINEVRQQLNYYNASVYKNEIVQILNQKIENLRTVAILIDDETLLEPLRDYDAISCVSGNTLAREDVSIPARYSRLINSLEKNLRLFIENIDGVHIPFSETNFRKNIRKYRRRLLAICRRGSRPWAILQSL